MPECAMKKLTTYPSLPHMTRTITNCVFKFESVVDNVTIIINVIHWEEKKMH